LFAQPTDALTLDLFRFLLGVPVLTYFLRKYFEARDFSGPDGRIVSSVSRFSESQVSVCFDHFAGTGYPAPLLLNTLKSPLFTIPGSLVYGHKE
jgi:hypothetical protein